MLNYGRRVTIDYYFGRDLDILLLLLRIVSICLCWTLLPVIHHDLSWLMGYGYLQIMSDPSFGGIGSHHFLSMLVCWLDVLAVNGALIAKYFLEKLFLRNHDRFCILLRFNCLRKLFHDFMLSQLFYLYSKLNLLFKLFNFQWNKTIIRWW